MRKYLNKNRLRTSDAKIVFDKKSDSAAEVWLLTPVVFGTAGRCGACLTSPNPYGG